MVFTFLELKVGLLKTINAVVSCRTLRRLRRAILSSGVVLIHGNARSHDAIVTQQLLGQLEWDVSDNRRLTTSDFHLFPELKKLVKRPKLPEKWVLTLL
ncbi:hypothetical protein AVEN_145739-1 [Araneus ventricosus]|uniref:Mariner Mos1 transposase n=1 Tax=Araneus ventricosus TaxID=182803 RepID=A0A4Y2UST1_ARAVE|nr:hypothetical protein AVEN_145739-1 [Araneus ventricosus]